MICIGSTRRTGSVATVCTSNLSITAGRAINAIVQRRCSFCSGILADWAGKTGRCIGGAAICAVRTCYAIFTRWSALFVLVHSFAAVCARDTLSSIGRKSSSVTPRTKWAACVCLKFSGNAWQTKRFLFPPLISTHLSLHNQHI